MPEIIPAILEKNYEDLKNKIALVRGIVSIVQVDICDGVFVKTVTWPFESGAENLRILSSPGSRSEGEGRRDEKFEDSPLDAHFLKILNEQEGMPFWEDMDFELDLMVENAVENFDIYTKLGPKRIIFHLEAIANQEDFKNFLEGIDEYLRDVIQIGVAINPSTPVEQIFPIVNNIDFVQCMGNDKIAHKGVPLDPKVYEKIKVLRERYPDLPIAVDIGVDESTAPMLVDAGATKLVAGSAIFNSDDIIGTIEKFRNF